MQHGQQIKDNEEEKNQTSMQADQKENELTTKMKQLQGELEYQRGENDSMKDQVEEYRKQAAGLGENNEGLTRQMESSMLQINSMSE
jgi:predicted RNase H-like nuclease (RuvC/YqgF family)